MRNRPRRADGGPCGDVSPLVARYDDLWLLSSGPGLVLLVESGPDRAAGHRRVAEAAEQLRCELFEHLTVVPFVDPLVLVPDHDQPADGELARGALRHLVLPEPVPPAVERIVALIDAGSLRLPWRRLPLSCVAG